MNEAIETPSTAAMTAATLAAALQASRRRTLALFQCLQAAIGAEALPRYLPELSPPRWDLGHLAWYEGWWIGRNPGLMAGDGAHAATARAPSTLLPQADTWFDDRRVNQPARWNQPLPKAAVLVDWARRTREHTLALLPAAARRPAALALFTRVLDAEDRLHEDWLGIAQTLGIWPGDAADDPGAVADQAGTAGPGAAEAASPPAIDSSPVTWARFLPFVDAGGYEERSFWSDEGWEWRKRQGLVRPRHLAEPAEPGGLPRRARFGEWVPLDPAQPAMHLSAHEAQAWCRWAGRRLPTATEWLAAQAADPGFAWGEVWEWVLAGEPDAGADGAPARALLMGACFATAPRLRGQPSGRPRPAERNDGFSGFRSALAAAA